MTVLRILGKLLISLGAGVLLFVGWTLWGTGLYTERQQSALAETFAAQPEAPPPRAGAEPTGPPAGFDPGPGDPVFRLRIPAMQLDRIVVEGVGTEQLRLGPGHYPGCDEDFLPPLCTEFEEIFPGERGRTVISAHRTTYGAPFWDLDRLSPGDRIVVDTKWGDFAYRVTRTEVVAADSRAIVIPTKTPELVLTTCNPRFSATQRLVVFAELA